jgi:SAM-dependent methyltransferase/3-polyprenyl-4-hydroxybenzoate decarboxylase
MALRQRAAVVRIFDHGDAITILGRVSRRFEGDSAGLLRAVLELHEQPINRDELMHQLAARSGGVVPEGPVDELCTLLETEGILVVPRPEAARPLTRRVVLAISGAIAAVDAPSLVRGLHALGCEVKVAITRSARQFIAPRALAALTHHPVMSSLWQGPPDAPAPHIELAEWAEVVVVCPASATTLARLAQGSAEELVSALVLASRAPVIVVPSMNDGMLASPAVQANLAALRAHGRSIVHAARGLEVAHVPGLRRSMLGPAPPAAVILEVIRHVLGELTPPPSLPTEAEGWARLWERTPPTQLPWNLAEADLPLLTALGQGQGKTCLDLGCGNGTVAIAAAGAGYQVTASDVAPAALALAHRRAGHLPVLFVLDDVTHSALRGPFDVIVDRGVLHGLPTGAWPAWAGTVSQLIAPGGRLLVVAHTARGARGTTPLDVAKLTALLPGFALVASEPIMLSGSDARLYTLAARATVGA